MRLRGNEGVVSKVGFVYEYVPGGYIVRESQKWGHDREGDESYKNDVAGILPQRDHRERRYTGSSCVQRLKKAREGERWGFMIMVG